MRTKEFYDHRQAHAYLTNSIVMYNGIPVYINEVYPLDRGSFAATYYEVGRVGSGNRKEAKLDDKGWDFNPVPLGFMVNTSCNYASRIPQRAWKIGLTAENLNLHYIKPAFRVQKGDVFLHAAMRDTILGNYKTYKLARKNSNDNPVAFSRRFAVYKNDLYYKTITTPVGKAGEQPELNEKFGFLKEVLEEDLGR